MCTANLNVAINKVVYCQWLNEHAGIEADVTVTRLGANDYWVVSAAPCQRRDLSWLAEHSAGFDVDIEDITENYAVLGVMGPDSRGLLGSLTDADLGNRAFPFATSAEIQIAGKQLRASRITYVGALGWELYIPWQEAAAVYTAVAGLSPAHAGYHAMDSLRMEKAYRHWGHDISDEDTPIEAGLSFTVDWDKPGGFIGRDALLAQKSNGVKKRLGLFALEDPEPLLYHDEPIWQNGRPVGFITSGAFGHTVGTSLGFGYVTSDRPITRKELRAGRFEIEIGNKKFNARCTLRALHDPDNEQILA